MTKLRLHKSKAWLTQRFIYDNKTIEELAIEAGVTPMTIRRALEKENLLR